MTLKPARHCDIRQQGTCGIAAKSIFNFHAVGPIGTSKSAHNAKNTTPCCSNVSKHPLCSLTVLATFMAGAASHPFTDSLQDFAQADQHFGVGPKKIRLDRKCEASDLFGFEAWISFRDSCLSLQCHLEHWCPNCHIIFRGLSATTTTRFEHELVFVPMFLQRVSHNQQFSQKSDYRSPSPLDHLATSPVTERSLQARPLQAGCWKPMAKVGMGQKWLQQLKLLIELLKMRHVLHYLLRQVVRDVFHLRWPVKHPDEITVH